MQTFLVGGAVRDKLMGKVAKDRDWVVVGATPSDIQFLEKNGYKQVGADFPVYLHPETNEEYALARIERKVGEGYLGFACDTQNVTLEQDLLRRDLTMNAIAFHIPTGKYTDPYGGAQDIKNGIIRHVSDAFREDPVRVLRVARFAARYDFKVHESTKALMTQMAKNGELKHLQRERVMQEMVKCAEEGSNMATFVRVLRNCGAWDEIFPSIKAPTNEQLEVINKACTSCAQVNAMSSFVASLLMFSADKLDNIQKEVVFPKQHFQFAKAAIRSHATLCEFQSLKADKIVEFFDSLQAHTRGGEHYIKLLNDFAFSVGDMTRFVDDYILKMYDLYFSVDIAPVLEKAKAQGTPIVGKAIGDTLKALRVEKISKVLK